MFYLPKTVNSSVAERARFKLDMQEPTGPPGLLPNYNVGKQLKVLAVVRQNESSSLYNISWRIKLF